MIQSVNMGYINKEDWKRFLEIIDDRDKQHDYWEDWYKEYLRLKEKLIKEGFNVTDYHVDLDELIKYCKKLNLKIDGKSRSRFVARGGSGEE
jgi:hypothetical protein